MDQEAGYQQVNDCRGAQKGRGPVLGVLMPPNQADPVAEPQQGQDEDDRPAPHRHEHRHMDESLAQVVPARDSSTLAEDSEHTPGPGRRVGQVGNETCGDNEDRQQEPEPMGPQPPAQVDEGRKPSDASAIDEPYRM